MICLVETTCYKNFMFCFQHLDHGRQTVTPSLNNQQQQQLLKHQALATSSPHNNDVSMTHSPAPRNNHTPPGSVRQSHVSPAGQLVSKSTWYCSNSNQVNFFTRSLHKVDVHPCVSSPKLLNGLR